MFVGIFDFHVSPWGVAATHSCILSWQEPRVQVYLPPLQVTGEIFHTGQICCTPPPPCISYALVQATVGVGTVLIWDIGVAYTGRGVGI